MSSVMLEAEATMREKGQITIPRNIRKLVGLQEGAKLRFTANETEIRIQPIVTVSMSDLQDLVDRLKDPLGVGDNPTEADNDLVLQLERINSGRELYHFLQGVTTTDLPEELRAELANISISESI